MVRTQNVTSDEYCSTDRHILRIMEAGTYYTQVIFPDWGNGKILNARACYSSGECIKPGDLDTGENNARMTVVLWNDTQTVYTESSVDGDCVRIAYVEKLLQDV